MATADWTARPTLTARGAARGRHIVDTAARLFDELGYHRVSMGDIAEASGIAKATLYHYFRGKTQILYEIHHQYIYPLLEKQRERATTDIPPGEELRAIITDVLNFFAAKPGHMRVFSEHLRDLEGDERAEVVAHRDEYRRHVQRAIERGITDGQFVADDPRLAALTLLGAVNWAYQWFHAEGQMSTEQVADHIWRTLLLGLAPRRRAVVPHAHGDGSRSSHGTP